MRLPRDESGRRLAKRLEPLGYTIERQRGSHMTLRTEKNGDHSLTVPHHDPLKIGTLRAILRGVASHHALTYDDVLKLIFPPK